MAKLNCWEFKKCGREPGGAKSREMVCIATTEGSCSGANGGKNGGRICWSVAGTFCGGKVQGDFAQKTVSCMSCDFFKTVKQEEGADRFNLLKPSGNTRFQ
ncbi:MAG: hypothetical protein C4581_13310 [Nitrospiraceae bacterium]|nr:MAG: hypothetical protein C4581_13310 [Nitrospiraceae bacterium]